MSLDTNLDTGIASIARLPLVTHLIMIGTSPDVWCGVGVTTLTQMMSCHPLAVFA